MLIVFLLIQYQWKIAWSPWLMEVLKLAKIKKGQHLDFRLMVAQVLHTNVNLITEILKTVS